MEILLYVAVYLFVGLMLVSSEDDRIFGIESEEGKGAFLIDLLIIFITWPVWCIVSMYIFFKHLIKKLKK